MGEGIVGLLGGGRTELPLGVLDFLNDFVLEMASTERSLDRTSFFVFETTTAFFDLVEAANLSEAYLIWIRRVKAGGKSRERGRHDGWRWLGRGRYNDGRDN
jgi:hypothetical protein